MTAMRLREVMTMHTRIPGFLFPTSILPYHGLKYGLNVGFYSTLLIQHFFTLLESYDDLQVFPKL